MAVWDSQLTAVRTNQSFRLDQGPVWASILREHVKVSQVPHGGSTVWAVPWLLNLPHMHHQLLHLTAVQSSADHHLDGRQTYHEINLPEHMEKV